MIRFKSKKKLKRILDTVVKIHNTSMSDILSINHSVNRCMNESLIVPESFHLVVSTRWEIHNTIREMLLLEKLFDVCKARYNFRNQ